MTGPARAPQRHQLPAFVRRLGAAVAVAALGALIAVGPPVHVARAASSSGFDQITGAGETSSAVNVPWTGGLLGADNKPLATSSDQLAPNSDRALALAGSGGTPSGPLSFMYNDFKNLSVTVSQTQDITRQGLTVAWSGGTQTSVNFTAQANFLQLMECYGDSNSGPTPDQCEFGSQGLLPTGATNQGIGSRGGDLCPPNSAANPPVGIPAADGTSPIVGCDPEEPPSGQHVPSSEGSGLFTVPFKPADDPSSLAYTSADTDQWFNQFNTNEIQEAVSGANGKGRLQFETLTATQAAGLGCGEKESTGQVRNCWLVIVPRGTFEPNGFQVNLRSAGPSGFLFSSPLSATNWAMRIQIHLGYAPITSFCPPGTKEIGTAGVGIITRAMGSWELALNNQANCKIIYGFTGPDGTEQESTADLCNPAGTGVGLAFTTIAIGSEAARDKSVSSCPGGLPKILYAPVAVSALGFGFNINDGSGAVTTPVKMTPSLLARSLTQVYLSDLPDYYPKIQDNGPTWAASNPVNLSRDPVFQNLNPASSTGILGCCSESESLAPLLRSDNSAQNMQVWQWIQGDPATVAWLDKRTLSAGNTVAADPDYQKLQLGKQQLGTPGVTEFFPRAYKGFLDLPDNSGGKGPPGDDNTTGVDQTRHSLDLLPYVANYDDAAANVLTGNNPATGNWNPQQQSPQNTTGWWATNPPQALGQVFIWAISDTPDLASYGLVAAQLCNDLGGNCVAPTTASLTAAIASAKPDSSGLLHVNPAKPGKNAYPLVQVTYAAVATNQSAAVLKDYANLIAYAAGPGQKAGVAPGSLPPGYLPLTKALKNQALAVVKQLQKLASPTPAHSSGPGSTRSPAAGNGAGGGGSATPSPASSSPAEFTISQASPQLTSATTQRQVLGAIRWALLVVVIVGAACATSGAALRSARVPAWLKRMRT